MVNIAIAGGSGNVAREIVDVLVATNKHKILLLTRKDTSSEAPVPGATWVKADYHNLEALVAILNGVDTLLSFIVVDRDPESVAQKNLIDAAVRAGVRRFAPSEWATSSLHHMSWYSGKADVRAYLAELNKDRKVLEYTLFQPGLFLDYFCYPHKVTKHLHLFQIPFDFSHRRAIVVEGSNDVRITLTAVRDLARVVAGAVEYEDEWPVDGGIRGNELTMDEIVGLGEKLRGPFIVETLRGNDLGAGVVTSSWVPRIDHPSLSPDQVDGMAKVFLVGVLRGMSAGNFAVSDTWNKLLPDLEFTGAEEYLSKVWRADA